MYEHKERIYYYVLNLSVLYQKYCYALCDLTNLGTIWDCVAK